MSERLLLMLLVLTTLFNGSALAAEIPGAAAEPAQTAPAASAEILPDNVRDRLPPEPTYKYFEASGPCTASVTCGNPPVTYTIHCEGQTVCKWKVDNTSSPDTRGFVECDGNRLTCSSGGGGIIID